MNISNLELTSDVLASFREKFLATSMTSQEEERCQTLTQPTCPDPHVSVPVSGTVSLDLTMFSDSCRDSPGSPSSMTVYDDTGRSTSNVPIMVSCQDFLPYSEYESYTDLSDCHADTLAYIEQSSGSLKSTSPMSADGAELFSTFTGTFVKEEFPISSCSRRNSSLSSDKTPSSNSSDAGDISPDIIAPSVLVPTKTRSQHLLPPCRVCGDKASGFHYGANTCEACKGFFRRSLKKRPVEYQCNANKECKIQKGRRNNCPYCRYRRCLSIGMSKQAIKTGRYTHAKRTKDIVEVKQLSGDPDALKTSKESEIHLQGRQLSPDNVDLLQSIYTAHKILFPFWHKVLEEGGLEDKMKNYAEQYKLRSQARSPALSKDRSDALFYTTGMDLNGHATMDKLTDHIHLAITVFVRFAKVVPGFTELKLNDQAVLLKASRFEIWMIGAHRFMNRDLQVTSGPRGATFHLEELAVVMDREFIVRLFACAYQLQLLELSLQEVALLKCIVLTFADRADLQDPQRVEDIQMRLVTCLQELMASGRKFARVMSALTNLRDLTEMHNTVSRTILMDWPALQKHPLLVEILSV